MSRKEEDIIWIHRDLLRRLADALAVEGFQYLHCPEWQDCGHFTAIPGGETWRCPEHRRKGVAP